MSNSGESTKMVGWRTGRSAVGSLLVLALATAAYALYAGLTADRAASAHPSADLSSRAAAGRARISDRPFADALAVGDIAQARQRLPFSAAAPAALGQPEAVYIHETFRPQALGLVYRNTNLGHFIVTEELIDMSHEQQVTGLEQLAANCDPATGCEGTWTMRGIGTQNRALVISNLPDGVNAVIWIHGRVRYQVFGPAAEFELPNALGVGEAFEADANAR